MSAGFFAPSGLLAAVGMVTQGDDDLRDGIHLRVMPSPLIGFPLAPMGVFPVPARRRDLEEVRWRDRDGNPVPSGDLDAAGGYLTAEWAPSEDGRDVAVEVLSDRTLSGTVSLLDPAGDRVLSRTSQEPFRVAGPRVSRLRIEGTAGGSIWLQAWEVTPSSVAEAIIGQEPVAWLSLPVDGDRSWYVASQGERHAVDSVRTGAPWRTTPADDPDAAATGLDEDDEELRVTAFRGQTLERVEAMLADFDVLPRNARVPFDGQGEDGTRQIIDVSASSTLLAQAMDPGHGRYLGLVTDLDDPGEELAAYAVVGLFPVDRALKLPGGSKVASLLEPVPDLLQLVTDRFADRIQAQDLAQAVVDQHGDDVGVLGLLAVTAAPVAPDRPTMPEPALGAARWLDGGGGTSHAFQQQIVVDGAPLASLVALGKEQDGTWTTAHRQVGLPEGADPPVRAVALLLGRTGERPPLAARGVLTDSPVPAGRGTRYRLRLGDLFGRYGEPVELDAPDPPRPGPPAPALQPQVVLDGPEGTEPGRHSPGHVRVRIPVPPVGALTAGSLPIHSVRVSLEGSGEWHEGTGSVFEHTLVLPELGQGEVLDVAVSASFADEAGTKGPEAQVQVRANDRRPPPTVVVGRGIMWTSRPGPAPEVELRLTWPGSPGAGYRAYVADATSLGLTGSTRADIAKLGSDRDEQRQLGGRDRFRLLNDEPLKAMAGTVTLTELFPRSLATVQFVRIVPVTSLGHEAPFDECRAIPVAVPRDRRPPAPRVHARTRPDRPGAVVTVEAVGLDLVALRDAEPGLFSDPVAPDAVAPEFRVRRAMGPIGDPVYAPEIGRGPLSRIETDSGPVFTATFEDPRPLPPYVKVSYWAEVRMPPERRLARGVQVELPTAGGVAPVDPSQAQPMPGVFSLVSAPATVAAPAGPVPDRLTGTRASVGVEAGVATLNLTATGTPVAHRLAPRGFMLRLWERWGADDLAPVGQELPLAGRPVDFAGSPRPDPGDQPVSLVYSVVAPDGRAGTQHELVAEREVWESLGGRFVSSPTMCSPAPGRLSVLGVGLDHLVYERRRLGQTWDVGWNPISTSVAVTGPVTAAAAPDGTMLLATQRDEMPVLFRHAGGGWSEVGPGPMASVLAMVFLSGTELRQYGVRATGIHQSIWNGVAWSPVERLPGPVMGGGGVAAIATTGSRIDLVARGTDGFAHHRVFDGGGWRDWSRLGDLAVSSAPAIGRIGDSDLVVLARGLDGRLHWCRLGSAAGARWTRISAVEVVGSPAVANPAPGRLDVVVQRPDGALHHRWYDGAWHP